MRSPLFTVIILPILAIVVSGCGSSPSHGAQTLAETQPTIGPTAASIDVEQPVSSLPDSPTDTPPLPSPTASTPDTPKSEPDVAKNGKPLLNDQPIYSFEDYWATNFNLHTVSYSEIFSGGVPRDGIPPIDNPSFVSMAEAAGWLTDQEPVFVVTVNGQTKGYPLQVLIWHEVVNDTLAGVPIAVTFCPLCNSAVTLERTLNGQVLDFGVSGKLRNSDLIMWDRQTESWWQQLTGESIVGELVGEQLDIIPTQLVSFADFKTGFPDAPVLSKETGFNRPYGSNPYRGYDTDQQPFLFAGEIDSRLKAVERVIAIESGGEAAAYPYKVLADRHVVADTVGGQDVVIFWQAGTTSALDGGSIADSRDVGAAGVFDPNLNGQKLTFQWTGDAFVDNQTGSTWNIFGEAIAGELAGQTLTPVLHANHFWFAMAAFFPEVRIYQYP